MNKPTILFLWFTLPILFLIFHYGPGQRLIMLDKASSLQEKAQAKEAEGLYQEARELYNQAAKELKGEELKAQKVYLQMLSAKTFLNTADVAETTLQVEDLLQEVILDDNNTYPETLKNDLRASLAHAEFYTAWHMRLEGAPYKEWQREIDTARQNMRFLTTTKSKNMQVNLERAIYLQRIDLEKLRGLPLPKINSGKNSSVRDKMAKKRQPGDSGEGKPGKGGTKPSDSRGKGQGKAARSSLIGS